MKAWTQTRIGLLLLALVAFALFLPLAGSARAALNRLLPQAFDAGKTVNQTIAWPGTSVTYTLSLNNPTGLDLADVAVTDTLPISLTYNAGSLAAAKGSFNYAGGTITWTGSISSSEIVIISYGATLSTTLLSGDAITNSAVSTGGGELLTRTATVLISTNTYLPLILLDPTQTPTPTPTPNPWQTVIYEGFEGAFPGPWWLGASNNLATWGKRNCRTYAGGNSGWGVGANYYGGGALSCGSNYPDSTNAWMVYGPFSLSGYTAAELRYKAWVHTELLTDRLCRLASINGNQFYGTCTSDDTGGWVERVLDLTNVPTLGNLAGSPNVWIALVFQSNGSVNMPEGGYADEIFLRRCAGGCTGFSAAAPRSPNDRSVEGPNMLSRPQ